MKIPLTQGKFAFVDDGDYTLVSRYKWFAHCPNRRRGVFYALRNVGKCPNRTTQSMHTFLLALLPGQEGDHYDGDGLNNRRENLRPATARQNGANKKKRAAHSSKFKGVHKPQESKKFIAQICVGYKRRYLGSFVSEVAAALAYDAAALAFFGEFAAFNFPVKRRG